MRSIGLAIFTDLLFVIPAMANDVHSGRPFPLPLSAKQNHSEDEILHPTLVKCERNISRAWSDNKHSRAKLVCSFTLKDNAVDCLKIETSSGSTSIDAAALKCIEEACIMHTRKDFPEIPLLIYFTGRDWSNGRVEIQAKRIESAIIK